MNDTSPRRASTPNHAPDSADPFLASLASPAFFAKVHTRIWTRLARYKVPLQERADLAQDILLATHEGWSSFDPTVGRQDQWLNGIILNHVRRWYTRRANALVSLKEEGDGDEPASEHQNTEELLVSAQRLQLLDELLQQLPFEHRAVLVAHDLDGLTFEQIAAIFNKSVSTIYGYHKAAMAELRAALERWKAKQRTRGALLLPLAVEALLDADRTAPPSPPPAEEVERAWRRYRRALGDADPQGDTPASKPPATRPRPIHLRHSLPVIAYLLVGQPTVAPPEQPAAPVARVELPAEPDAGVQRTEPIVFAPAPRTPDLTNTAAATAAPPAAPPAVRAEPIPDSAAVVAEQATFDRAHAAFVQGDADAALEALQQHARKYPRGLHAFDRDRLWIEVLVELGRTAEACQRAERLGRAYPKSRLPSKVEAACAGSR